MSEFAKFFESEKYGQVVVIIQDNDEGNPEMRLWFKPVNLGVCSLAFSWDDDSDKSYTLQEKAFNNCNLEMVEKILKPVYADIGIFFED